MIKSMKVGVRCRQEEMRQSGRGMGPSNDASEKFLNGRTSHGTTCSCLRVLKWAATLPVTGERKNKTLGIWGIRGLLRNRQGQPGGKGP